MIKYLVFIILYSSLAFHCKAQKGYTVTDIKDVKTVFELAFNLEKVQEYLHYDSLPERLPIKFLAFGKINGDSMKGFELFDTAVEFLTQAEIDSLPNKNYFSIGDWTHVKSQLRVQLYYPVEGITINLMFHQIKDSLLINNYLITEH